MNNLSTEMEITRKRALIVVVGLLLAGSLLYCEHNPTRVAADAGVSEIIEEENLEESTGELRVKLLLLGVEFVVHRAANHE